MSIIAQFEVALALTLFSLGSQLACGEQSFRDDFRTGNLELWEEIPSGADYSQGSLNLASKEGQVAMVTTAEFEKCEMNLRFSPQVLGANDSIFYYLGFQTVTPWMRDAVYLMIQGQSFIVIVAKDGNIQVQHTVGGIGVVPGQEYDLSVRWNSEAIEFRIDNAVVFETNDAEKIPVGPLYGFVAANRIPGVGVPGDSAHLNVLSMTVDEL